MARRVVIPFPPVLSSLRVDLKNHLSSGDLCTGSVQIPLSFRISRLDLFIFVQGFPYTCRALRGMGPVQVSDGDAGHPLSGWGANPFLGVLSFGVPVCSPIS